MEMGQDLLKEVEKEVKRDKILNFIKNHFKKIIIVLSLIVIASVFYGSYRIYMGNKADKNSNLYYEMKDHLSTGDQKEAIVILDDLIKNGTNGYQFVSYLQKASISLKENKVQDAIDTLNLAIEKLSMPKYYVGLIKTIVFSLRMNDNKLVSDAKYRESLSKDIQSSLDKKSKFYFYNLEMYGSILFLEKKYDDSLKVFNEILNAPEVSQEIKARALRITSLLMGYVK
jgi:hypothetical protein